MEAPQFNFSGKRVLVTGGTGFIGGRLVERLIMECKADVRVLVRNLARASRIGRFPVEMIHGDLQEQQKIEQAVHGCDTIFHCAVGVDGSDEKQRRVNVDATRYLLEAALKAGVQRLVYISTVMVYGTPPDGDLDESTPKQPDDDIYSRSKLESEQLILEYAATRDLSATVLQPTIVYGPFAAAWTINVLKQLKRKRAILVNGGDGLCNAVYIEDLINAIFLAAVEERAIGEAVLISGDAPVTWQEFYGQFEKMLGCDSTVSMTAAEAEAYFVEKRGRKSLVKEAWTILKEEHQLRWRVRNTRGVDTLMKVGRAVLPKQLRHAVKNRIKNTNGMSSQMNNKRSMEADEKSIQILGPASIQFYASKVHVRIDKAKRLLGYKPIFDLNSGMKLTEQWARWANLL